VNGELPKAATGGPAVADLPALKDMAQWKMGLPPSGG